MGSQADSAVSTTVCRADFLAENSSNKLLDECTRCADEIILLLEEESAVLRSFKGEDLMHLLAKKEYLFNGLTERIRLLGTDSGCPVSGARGPLKERLHRIELLNRVNRAFIESTLAFYQDFLNCLCPCVYGRGQEGRPERAPAPIRGVALKKEI